MADEQAKTSAAQQPPEAQPQAEEQFWPFDQNSQEDAELIALAEEQGPQSVLRPILMIIVLILGAGIISDREEELRYFFSAEKPVVLGDVTEFPAKRAQDPSWQPTLPHNRYVQLSGIPSKRAINTKYRFMKLVGADIYVELRKGEDPNKSAVERVADELNKKPEEGRDRDFYEGQGRLLHFNAIPDRYQGLKTYYGRHYNTAFCVDLSEQQRKRIAQERRDLVLRNWKKRFDAANEEQRKSENLTERPSQAELDEVVNSEPICVDAYLIQSGVKPKDHWWYLALCAMIAAFMAFDFVLLIKWVIRFLKPRDL